jgi:hypothetical protein
MKTMALGPVVRAARREEVKTASSNYKLSLKKPVEHETRRQEILAAFATSKLPEYGSMIFNGQQI